MYCSDGKGYCVWQLSLRRKRWQLFVDESSRRYYDAEQFLLAEIVHGIRALLTDSALYHNNIYVLRDRVRIGMIYNNYCVTGR